MTAIRAVLAALFLFLTTAVSAATFTVTSSAEDGPGTLKQAILDANANPGLDQIRFTVAAVTVEPSGLPTITDPVDIDGANGSTARVEITMPAALPVNGGFEFDPGSSGSTLRHVNVHDIVGAAVLIAPGVTGVTVADSIFTHPVTIGGNANLFTGNVMQLNAAITVSGDGNTVVANTIRTIDITLGANDNQIGGTGTGNTIATLTSQGHNLFVNENTFTGTGAGTAIAISGGTFTSLFRNTISGYATGVSVNGATGVSIINNSIFDTGIPIDLGANGPTANDPAPDADLGANNLQNYPVLTSAVSTTGFVAMTGTLTSAPLTNYRIELFANPASDPDARTVLSSFLVTTDATGTVTFTRSNAAPPGDQVITATATNESTNDTSEVSPPVEITEPGSLSIADTTLDVGEGAGTVTVTVNRTGGSDGTVTVDYATQNGTATSPADFTATTGTLTFGPGVTTQSFTIPIVADNVPEGAETFTVALSNETGGAFLGAGTATITIAANLPGQAIPTASTWALLLLAAALAAITLSRISN